MAAGAMAGDGGGPPAEVAAARGGRLRRTLFGVALVLALASLLALAPQPGWQGPWPLALLTPFRPQMLWASVATLGLAAAARCRWRSVALAAVGVVVNLAVVWPWLAPARVAAPAESFRLMSWNGWASNADPGALLRGVVDAAPDVAILCETPRAWRRQAPELAGYRTAALDQFLVLVRDGGAVTLEAFKPGAVGVLSEVRLTFAGRPVRVLAVHLARPNFPAGVWLQRGALGHVVAWLQSEPGTPAVVCGDFNLTPWCAPLRNLMAQTDLVDPSRGQGAPNTYTMKAFYPLVGLLGVPIDHVLHTPGLAHGERRVLSEASSNHRPVVLTLAWPAVN